MTLEEMKRQGGKWLGSARSWLQWNTKNGETVTWGSNDCIEPQMTVKMVEDVAAHVAKASANEATQKQSLLLKAAYHLLHNAQVKVPDGPTDWDLGIETLDELLQRNVCRGLKLAPMDEAKEWEMYKTLDIYSNHKTRCLRCGIPITLDTDSGWEEFTEDGGGRITQPVCISCDTNEIIPTEKEYVGISNRSRND